MLVPRWVSTVGLAVVGAALAAAGVVVATAVWLLTGYRPSADGVDPALLDTGARASTTWSDVHQGALVALVVLLALVVVTGPVVVAEEGRGIRRPVATALVALVGAAGAVVGALTTARVAWDQVALGEVTVATDLSGWRLAALDDRVRFVLVDGVEVAPSTYAAALAVHLVAPLVAGAAVVAVLVLVRGVRRRDRSLAGGAICG